MATEIISQAEELEKKLVENVEHELQDGVYDVEGVEPYEPTPKTPLMTKLRESKFFARVTKKT